MIIFKLIAGVFGGFLTAILTALVFSLSVAGDPQTMESANESGLILGWLAGFTLALTASRPAKSWRRIFATCGLLAFALPISSMVFTYTSTVEAGGRDGSAGAAGAILGGGMATFAIGFGAFFIGLIFSALAYFIGRDK